MTVVILLEMTTNRQMQHHILNTPQHHVCSLQSLRAHCDHEPSWGFRASVRGKKQPIFRKSLENPARRRSPGFIRPSLLPGRTQKSGSGGILVVAINKFVSIRGFRPNRQSEFCILRSDFCILTSPCAHNPTPTAKQRPEALTKPITFTSPIRTPPEEIANGQNCKPAPRAMYSTTNDANTNA